MNQDHMDILDEVMTGFSYQEYNSSRIVKQLSLISSEGGEATMALSNLMHFDDLNWDEVYSNHSLASNNKESALRKHVPAVKKPKAK